MSAFTVPLPAAGAHLVVDAGGRPCAACGRLATLLVARWMGTELITRCLACDLAA